VVIVPHIASATVWTREGMATLAASNVAGILMGYPAWQENDISLFLTTNPPKAAPSIVNAKEVGMHLFTRQIRKEKEQMRIDRKNKPVWERKRPLLSLLRRLPLPPKETRCIPSTWVT